MTQPTVHNPENQLNTKHRVRYSLEWLHFAIEELTPFKLSQHGLGVRALFVVMASEIGYDRHEIGLYLGWGGGGGCNANAAKHSLKTTESPYIREAWAVIEKMVRNSK
jgi:hypothetical protein